MAYHTKKIRKGILGNFSKIKEEFEELEDAHQQECKLLELCELADILGAIEAYIQRYNLSLKDLNKMKNLTKSSFVDRTRH